MGYEINRNLNGVMSAGMPSINTRPSVATISGAKPAAMNDRELAEHLGISRKTLQKWRSLGMGPPYMKLGAKVVYRAQDIEAYIQSSLRLHR